jgi:3D-(3,5/4)-trihydroxycyclohexane-1,2-dione acylhydrolase (decyclizing)
VLDTDPINTTDAGGAWWNVAVPATSTRPEVNQARHKYEEALASQRVGD